MVLFTAVEFKVDIKNNHQQMRGKKYEKKSNQTTKPWVMFFSFN